tara:strand:- start:863 stop:1000 length:138 start_codon:yes stop_codon:yes gene_type:complete
MGINFSSDTSKAIIEEYEYRIEALLNKIIFLEAQLEVVNKEKNYI